MADLKLKGKVVRALEKQMPCTRSSDEVVGTCRSRGSWPMKRIGQKPGVKQTGNCAATEKPDAWWLSSGWEAYLYFLLFICVSIPGVTSINVWKAWFRPALGSQLASAHWGLTWEQGTRPWATAWFCGRALPIHCIYSKPFFLTFLPKVVPGLW